MILITARTFITAILFFVLSSSVNCQGPVGAMTFLVSMEQPSTHYYHVILKWEGVHVESIDFKLPSWTPGYYWIMNFAKNVVNFNVNSERGNLLAWVKTNKNTWHVKSGKEKNIIYAFVGVSRQN